MQWRNKRQKEIIAFIVWFDECLPNINSIRFIETVRQLNWMGSNWFHLSWSRVFTKRIISALALCLVNFVCFWTVIICECLKEKKESILLWRRNDFLTETAAKEILKWKKISLENQTIIIIFIRWQHINYYLKMRWYCFDGTDDLYGFWSLENNTKSKLSSLSFLRISIVFFHIFLHSIVSFLFATIGDAHSFPTFLNDNEEEKRWKKNGKYFTEFHK